MLAKGAALKGFLAIPEEITAAKAGKQLTAQVKPLLKAFHQQVNKKVFLSTPKPTQLTRSAKSFIAPVKFHVYSASSFAGKFKQTKVLVVKEKNGVILGYREYVRR